MSQERFTIHNGNSLDILATLPESSVDAVVTDPPYELGFMGKGWDSSGIANSVPLWQGVLRALKPGGHLLAFSGTRTYHRMACAIEDAGFEIRDQMAWTYGTGFPKSLDVSKAIDASDAIGTRRERQLRFTRWMKSTGITAAEINAATASNMASHYLTEKEQPSVATEEMFAHLRPIIRARGHTIPEEIEELVRWRTVESENMKRRQVIRTKIATDTSVTRIACAVAAQGLAVAPKREIGITAAHTEAAKKWEGWGTALKPAWEPICVARKPLVGTVADNVMAYGTGALNIDANRIPYADEADLALCQMKNPGRTETVTSGVYGANRPQQKVNTEGRWPANIIHDGSAEVLQAFPEEQGLSTSRFFYCAKASREDREEGNIHPTVKPTELMRHLCRLVTPRGGLVLDPFMGSGSTGKAAMLEGLRFLGIDLTPEYCEIARARIAGAATAQLAADQQTRTASTGAGQQLALFA